MQFKKDIKTGKEDYGRMTGGMAALSDPIPIG